MNSCVVIAPHPDDETLGAGGTLLRLARAGCELHWMILTEMQVEYGWSHARVAQRQGEIEQVAARLGFSSVHNLGLQPAGLDQLPMANLIEKMGEALDSINPDTLIVPWRGDAHSDHRVAFDAATAVSKVFRRPGIRRVLSMEILSETDGTHGEALAPNYFVDISDVLEEKIDIMRIYQSEMGVHPFPRSEESLRALAVLRGAQSGFEFAEGFRVIRWIADEILLGEINGS